MDEFRNKAELLETNSRIGIESVLVELLCDIRDVLVKIYYKEK